MKTEIVSFNHVVRDLSSLLDLEGSELDVVIGGVMATDCPNLKTCDVYGSCGTKCGIDASLEMSAT